MQPRVLLSVQQCTVYSVQLRTYVCIYYKVSNSLVGENTNNNCPNWGVFV